MDDPELDAGRHRHALQALARINRISMAGWRLWREVRELAHSGEPSDAGSQPLRVLDVACGGGDVVAWVATRARRTGLPLEIHGCDVSPRALENARDWWEAVAPASGHGPTDPGAGRGSPYPAADSLRPHFFRLDALRDPMPGDYDLVTSSLFVHHLERAEAVTLLRRMAEACRRRLFVQDLCRTRLGYVLAWLGLHTLTRSDVARTDGLLSVEAAFTRAEVRELCAEAGLVGAVISSSWPQRWTVRWERGRVA